MEKAFIVYQFSVAAAKPPTEIIVCYWGGLNKSEHESGQKNGKKNQEKKGKT